MDAINNSTGYDYTTASDAITRQRALANALLNQQMQPLQGQKFQNAYGTFYGGGDTGFTALAKALGAGLNAYTNKQLDQQQKDNISKANAQLQSDLDNAPVGSQTDVPGIAPTADQPPAPVPQPAPVQPTLQDIPGSAIAPPAPQQPAPQPSPQVSAAPSGPTMPASLPASAPGADGANSAMYTTKPIWERVGNALTRAFADGGGKDSTDYPPATAVNPALASKTLAGQPTTPPVPGPVAPSPVNPSLASRLLAAQQATPEQEVAPLTADQLPVSGPTTQDVANMGTSGFTVQNNPTQGQQLAWIAKLRQDGPMGQAAADGMMAKMFQTPDETALMSQDGATIYKYDKHALRPDQVIATGMHGAPLGDPIPQKDGTLVQRFKDGRSEIVQGPDGKPMVSQTAFDASQRGTNEQAGAVAKIDQANADVSQYLDNAKKLRVLVGQMGRLPTPGQVAQFNQLRGAMSLGTLKGSLGSTGNEGGPTRLTDTDVALSESMLPSWENQFLDGGKTNQASIDQQIKIVGAKQKALAEERGRISAMNPSTPTTSAVTAPPRGQSVSSSNPNYYAPRG